jgi:hypothetical protein
MISSTRPPRSAFGSTGCSVAHQKHRADRISQRAHLPRRHLPHAVLGRRRARCHHIYNCKLLRRKYRCIMLLNESASYLSLQFLSRAFRLLTSQDADWPQRVTHVLRLCLFSFLFTFPVMTLLGFTFASFNYYILFRITPYFISRLLFHCYMCAIITRLPTCIV